MITDPQEALSRFHGALTDELASRYPRARETSITVADIYYDLVPFETCRETLGVESVLHYEQALIRLLVGQGGLLELESLSHRHEFQRHLDSRGSDPGLIRQYLNAGVRVSLPVEEEISTAGEETAVSGFEECPSCSQNLPTNASPNFCPFCGDDLRRVNCSSCEEQLRLHWRFCNACGAEVEPEGGQQALH